MVPFLYFVYDGWGAGWGWVVPQALEATVAHATSLFVIVPTAIVGAWSYHRSGLVSWRTAAPIGIFSVVGGITGARLAIVLPAELLKLAFSVFLLLTAIQLGAGRPKGPDRPTRHSPAATVPVGFTVGVFSALLGVGGGLVAIPLLLHVIGLEIRKVAATSLAVIVFAASAGTATYIIGGLGQAGLPEGSIGYVHAAAAVPLMLGSVVTVRLGAIVNQRMHVRVLQLLFAALLFVLGARLLLQSASSLI